jgi:hypothetical protein
MTVSVSVQRGSSCTGRIGRSEREVEEKRREVKEKRREEEECDETDSHDGPVRRRCLVV